MKRMKFHLTGLLALLILIAGSSGALFAQSGEPGMNPLSGLWINTAYNGDPSAALLIWTREGTLKSYDESYDTRCAGECRAAVSETWSENGYTCADVAVVNSFLGGVELRVSHEVYRMRADGTTLERIAVSAIPAPHPTVVDTASTAYRIWYRQRPYGPTTDRDAPAPAASAPGGA